MSLFHNALLKGFGLLAAFGQDGLAFSIKVGNAGLYRGQLLLGRLATFVKIVQGILDAFAAVLKETLGQAADEVPEDAGKNHEVEHAPAEVAPTRRGMSFRSHGSRRNDHQRGKGNNERQDKTRVFPSAQSPPPLFDNIPIRKQFPMMPATRSVAERPAKACVSAAC